MQSGEHGSTFSPSVHGVVGALASPYQFVRAPAMRRNVQERADPSETYKSWTPLMKAAEEDNATIIQLLMEKGPCSLYDAGVAGQSMRSCTRGLPSLCACHIQMSSSSAVLAGFAHSGRMPTILC